MAVHSSASISSRGQTQTDIVTIFLVLTWVFVFLRVFTRTWVVSIFGWDDATIIFTEILYTIYCIAMIMIQINGGGTHVVDVANLIRLNKWVVVGEAMYGATVMFLKISVGIFFARIVVKPSQLMLIYITVSVNIVSSLISVFYVIFRCGADLDVYVYKQLAWHCTPRSLDRFVAFEQASFTTLTDFVFILLPIMILWNASMDIRAKLSVGLILSLATLGCICSLIRFQYVDGLTEINDFFWNATNAAIWSTIEPGAGIIAACLATLRPCLKRFFITARSVHSSAFRSAREMSRPFQSKQNSSKQQSSTENSARHKSAKASRTGSFTNDYPPSNHVFELKSDIRKKSESTDLILTMTDEGHSLDLDRRSSKTARTMWTTRSGVDSITQLPDPILPPLPPAFVKRDEES